MLKQNLEHCFFFDSHLILYETFTKYEKYDINNKMKLNEVQKVTSIKEMLNLAVKEAGDKIAFEYKDENDKNKNIKVTYKEFVKDTEELGTAITEI